MIIFTFIMIGIIGIWIGFLLGMTITIMYFLKMFKKEFVNNKEFINNIKLNK